MSNYVRACFCVEHVIPAVQFYDLLKALDWLGCKFNVWITGRVSGYLSLTDQAISVEESILDQDSDPAKLRQITNWLTLPGYLNIELGWQIDNRLYIARLLQSYHQGKGRRALSLDIEDRAFLAGRLIKFTPKNDDILYKTFKQMIIQFITHIEPFIGIIDYEADLPCQMLEKYDSFVSWGNYFSQLALNQWSPDDLETLLQVVDEHIHINDLGILTFIHPLTANQAWTDRHKQIHTLLQRNPIIPIS